MYGCTTYEVVLPYECFARSDPVTGTKEWRDRVSVNIWLLSIDDISSVTTKVSDCQRQLEIYIKLPSILDYHRLDERNSLCYYWEDTGNAIYPEMHVRSIAQRKRLCHFPGIRMKKFTSEW
jgi:hypothetical protein